ncbi:MAG TPA: hypothetical protein VGZ52_13010 [Acidimicrobiales bacterium]|jgi:hypothetical protein|nr:hypothetical protein [Acidimicrobiales bacterium]
MPSITETLSGLQDQVLDLMKTVQEPAIDAVEKVVETVEGVLPDDRPTVPFADSLPDPAESIDAAFGVAVQLVDGQHDFVKAILANQRDFAKAIVKAISPLLPTSAASPVKRVATKTTKAA